MPDIKLVAETGRGRGSAEARRLRRSGKIPGVVYGHGIQATPVAVDARLLRAALSTESGQNAVLELDLDGNHQLALAREIQRHPVRGTVSHIDFVIVRRDEVVTVDVPVTLAGEAKQVLQSGGLVDLSLHTLSIKATPGRIPTAIEVDVSVLTLGGAIRVGDLRLPSGVSTEVDPDTVVVLGEAPRVVTEVAEGEGAAPAEGEAASEGAQEPGAQESAATPEG